jgi:hypothetical protein
MGLQVAITNVLLWFCIWTPYAVVTMIGQFGNPMLVTPLVSQLPAFLGKHKVHLYKDYHRVCPVVGIGTFPPPLSPASVPLPRNQRWGGGHTRLLVRGWGSPNSDDWKA